MLKEYSFQQWWQNLASIFADDDHVIFDLNNEPNGISASDAESLMQAGINGVRASGASNIIFVEGTSWTGAWSTLPLYALQYSLTMHSLGIIWKWRCVYKHQRSSRQYYP